jgi:protein-disulfide isomerase
VLPLVCLGYDDTAQITALRREIDEIQTTQKDIQKRLQGLKDLLTGKQPALENVFVNIAGSPTLGNDHAAVTVVEFTDFQCPFCAAYTRETLGRILGDYVDTGKVRYVVRSFPLEQVHPLAEKAAEGALCAGDQGKYWPAHDRFFANQQKLAVDEMPGHAAALGLDSAVFHECLTRGKYAAVVDSDLEEGHALDVRGTPTFFIGFTDAQNPRRIRAIRSLAGNLPFREFQKAIEESLAEQSQEAGAK